MKLSMWILADWLKKYSPTLHIRDGFTSLRGVRIFSSETFIEPQNVYLGYAEDFIPSGTNNIICVHGNDIILLETKDMEAILNDIFGAFDFYNRWSDDLKEKIMSGCTLQDLIDESHPVFNDPMVLYDSGNIVLAYSSFFPVGSLDGEWDHMLTTKSNSLEKLSSISEYLQTANFRTTVHTEKLSNFTYPSLWRNIYQHNRHMGRLLLIAKNNVITKGRMALLDELGFLIESCISQNHSRQELEKNHELFSQLLEGQTVLEKDLLQRMELLSWQKSDPKLVLSIFGSSSHDIIARPLILNLDRTFPSSFVFQYKSNLIFIANLKIIPSSLLIKMIRPLLHQSKAYCGISYEFTNIMDLKNYYEQSIIAVKQKVCQIGQIYFCKDNVLNYFYNVSKSHIHPGILMPELIQIKEYDKKNKSQFCETLFQYIRNERSLVKTAQELCIHRNTLMYRIHKIVDLTHLDLDNPEVRELYLLAIRLDKLGN